MFFYYIPCAGVEACSEDTAQYVARGYFGSDASTSVWLVPGTWED